MSLRRKRQTPSAVEQQREAASKRADQAFSDAHERQTEQAWEVKAQTDRLVTELMAGTAKLAEVQGALSADYSTNPYVDCGGLETQAMLMGLDPGTGQIGAAGSVFLEAIRNGATEGQALAGAMVAPTSLALWRQDQDFERDYQRARTRSE